MIKDKKKVILWNKTDLKPAFQENDLCKKAMDVIDEDISKLIIKTSTIQHDGLHLLEKYIESMFFSGEIIYNDEVIITNMRQKAALSDSLESLRNVIISIENDMPEDFYSIDLMSSYSSLGTMIGEEVGEDLVNEIFSKFCTGK